MTATLFIVGDDGNIWHHSNDGVWSNHNISAMGTR